MDYDQWDVVDSMCDIPEAHSLDAVFPFLVTRAMGFSWSSFVSPSTRLGICSEVGLGGDSVLSADKLTSKSTDYASAAAAGDVIVMGSAGLGSAEIAKAVEASMEANEMKVPYRQTC